jgi:mannose-6-phosphate isomerase-like protein (cupin superfamily)
MTDNPTVKDKKAAKHSMGAAHTISGDEKAHARHSIAKMNAQKEKNETKEAAHAQHKNAGTASHKIVYDAKTGGHRAEPDNATADAHNPHKHAGIESYKVSHDAKTDAHGTSKKGFIANIEEETKKNMDFRRVLYTGKNFQLVLMRLKPMEDIGMETHDDVDQFFRFEEGTGAVVIDGKKHAVKDGGAVIVPCGAEHNVMNTSKTTDLKLYTIYSPPEHMDKVVRKTKQEALAKEEHFDGKTTE